MKLLVSDIPDGSVAFRGWYQASPEQKDTGEDIDVVGILARLSPATVEVQLTKGRLTRGMMLKLADKARELGYRELLFTRTRKFRLSYAELVESTPDYHVYRVDLTED